MSEVDPADPIAESHRVFIDAMKSGNVGQIVALIEDGFVFMPPADTTLHGKEEVRTWFDEYFEYFTVLDLDATERTVDIVGDCLMERVGVSVKLVAKKGGTPIYDDARMLQIWRRQSDGSWKMWQSMWNSVKAIGAGTNRFLVRFMQGRDDE